MFKKQDCFIHFVRLKNLNMCCSLRPHYVKYIIRCFFGNERRKISWKNSPMGNAQRIPKKSEVTQVPSFSRKRRLTFQLCVVVGFLLVISRKVFYSSELGRCKRIPNPIQSFYNLTFSFASGLENGKKKRRSYQSFLISSLLRNCWISILCF